MYAMSSNSKNDTMLPDGNVTTMRTWWRALRDRDR